MPPPGPAARGRPPVAAVDRLSLEQQVGQTLILAFAGTTEPEYVARILHRRDAAGVILTGANVASAGQVRALTRRLEESARGSALIGADQEGGATRTLPFAAAVTPQAGQRDAAAAGADARATGRGLRGLGLNVDFAPVADVATGEGSIMRSRAFAGDAHAVAAATAAAVAGYEATGVAATAKHFPGLGAATTNTDDGPATVAASRALLDGRDLLPFRAAIAAGVPLIMASHALYPALDPARIASQSPMVLDGLLRGSLGFRGVVVTDSIEAAAVRRRSSVQVAAGRSIAAGADLVLMTGPGSYNLIYPYLLARARRSPAFRARVRQAAALVLALERRIAVARRE
ncbi:MAG TPA: glycoside hydrolase family 3 N-terminal domain-containing protein [Solirubrobacteraceae bacterium]|jgi:beta-N-acetylhexosaminidase|nr:glycoside hydrolase family 3 N-terminal domain-containing protein [Solirubrobacteraceae bacterium]